MKDLKVGECYQSLMYNGKWLTVKILQDHPCGHVCEVVVPHSSTYAVGDTYNIWTEDNTWWPIDIPKPPAYNHKCSCTGLTLWRVGCVCVRPACTCTAFDRHNFGCRCGASHN